MLALTPQCATLKEANTSSFKVLAAKMTQALRNLSLAEET